MGRFVRAAAVDEIPEGTGKALVLDGRKVALFHVAGGFHALDGRCPHQGGPLGEGILDGTVVSCPWHFWQFDVVKGHPPDFPEALLATFRVKVEDGQVFVEV